MSDQPEDQPDDGPGNGWDEQPATPDPVRTGVTPVDEVIAAVEGLDGRPVEEHVAVFETAHEQLRRALDAQQHDERA